MNRFIDSIQPRLGRIENQRPVRKEHTIFKTHVKLSIFFLDRCTIAELNFIATSVPDASPRLIMYLLVLECVHMVEDSHLSRTKSYSKSKYSQSLAKSPSRWGVNSIKNVVRVYKTVFPGPLFLYHTKPPFIYTIFVELSILRCAPFSTGHFL